MEAMTQHLQARQRIVGASGKLYAHGTVTCILFRDTTEARDEP